MEGWLAHSSKACGWPLPPPRSATSAEIVEAIYEGLGSPVECDSVPHWGEFALEILRLHIHMITNQMRTVIPALATVIQAEGVSAVDPVAPTEGSRACEECPHAATPEA